MLKGAVLHYGNEVLEETCVNANFIVSVVSCETAHTT